MTEGAVTPQRPRWARGLVIALFVVLGLILAAGVWIGVRAVMAKGELEAILPLVQPVQDAVQTRDFDRLAELAGQAQDHAAAAADLTGDPVWRAAEIVPFVGQNLAAVRVVSASLAGISSSAGPLLTVASDLKGSSETGFDLALFAQAQQPLADAADAFGAADASFDALDRSALIPQVAEAVDKVGTIVGDGAPVTSGLAQASRILPTFLGADEPRTILVMLQNSAELRTGGGLTGSFILLGADGGHLEILAQADSSDFRSLDAALPIVPASTIDLYSDAIGRWVQNTSMTADFELTAALANTWWKSYSGAEADAIVSLDLTTIAALLSTAAPVTLPDGSTITDENIVDRVLVEPYFTLDQTQQTAFQTLVTTAAMNSIVHADIDPFAWVNALSAPVTEGRVSVWSSDPAEQAVIDETVLVGPAGRLSAAGADAFGVYFNDETAGKMDSYLEASIASGASTCRPDGATDVRIQVTLTNTAAADAASWPWLMTGGGHEGVAPGDIGTSISVAAPAGTIFEGAWVDGAPVSLSKGEDAGFLTNRALITVSPGQSKTAEFRLVVDDAPQGVIDILHTPLLRAPELSTIEVACS